MPISQVRIRADQLATFIRAISARDIYIGGDVKRCEDPFYETGCYTLSITGGEVPEFRDCHTTFHEVDGEIRVELYEYNPFLGSVRDDKGLWHRLPRRLEPDCVVAAVSQFRPKLREYTSRIHVHRTLFEIFIESACRVGIAIIGCDSSIHNIHHRNGCVILTIKGERVPDSAFCFGSFRGESELEQSTFILNQYDPNTDSLMIDGQFHPIYRKSSEDHSPSSPYYTFAARTILADTEYPVENDAPNQQTERTLTPEQVAMRYSISVDCLWRWSHLQIDFPAPIMTNGDACWLLKDLLEYDAEFLVPEFNQVD